MEKFKSKWEFWSSTDSTDITDETQSDLIRPTLGSFGGGTSDTLNSHLSNPKKADKSCDEGYWIEHNGEIHRLKAYLIVDGCRHAARYLIDRLGITSSVLSPILHPPVAFKSKTFEDWLTGHHSGFYDPLVNAMMEDFSHSTLSHLGSTTIESLAMTSLAGELGVMAGLLPWPQHICRIAVLDYAESVVHYQYAFQSTFLSSNSETGIGSIENDPSVPKSNIWERPLL